MKPLWTLSLALTLLLALGCGKDEETTDEEGGEDAGDSSGDASGGGDGGNGEFDAASANSGGNGGNDGGDSSQAQAPTPKQPATPAIDRSKLPIGKQQIWTFQSGQNNDLLKIYTGKNISVVAQVFGKPDAWQPQNNGTLVYTYDKMQVRAGQNMEYSKIHFLIKPIPTEQGGGGLVQRVSVDPSSGKQMQTASTNPGQGGGNAGYPGAGNAGGYPGGGDPNGGSSDDGNTPPPGYPGGPGGQ